MTTKQWVTIIRNSADELSFIYVICIDVQSFLFIRCNGRYVLSLCPTGQELENARRIVNDSESEYERFGYILGLNGDQIAYCTQASSGLTLVGGIEAVVLSGNMYHTEEKLYVAFDKENSQKLKSKLFAPNGTWDTSLDVTFTLKYSYFEGLRRSVKNILPNVLRKISPQPGDFCSFVKCSYSPTIRGLMSGCSVDQREALEAILSCPPYNSPPILITGAFGTGKTRILAVAACCLLEQGKETAHPVRILATSHHHKSPDTFLEHYYDLRKDFNYDNAFVIRLQNRERHNRDHETNIPHQIYYGVDKLRKEMQRIKAHRLFMLACTYGSALGLAQSLPGFFTHILIDEGAQSREPEALSPLRLADENTKIVIAGDQHQVRGRGYLLINLTLSRSTLLGWAKDPGVRGSPSAAWLGCVPFAASLQPLQEARLQRVCPSVQLRTDHQLPLLS